MGALQKKENRKIVKREKRRNFILFALTNKIQIGNSQMSIRKRAQ